MLRNLSVSNRRPETASASISSNSVSNPSSSKPRVARHRAVHLAVDAIEIADLVGIQVDPDRYTAAAPADHRIDEAVVFEPPLVVPVQRVSGHQRLDGMARPARNHASTKKAGPQHRSALDSSYGGESVTAAARFNCLWASVQGVRPRKRRPTSSINRFASRHGDLEHGGIGRPMAARRFFLPSWPPWRTMAMRLLRTTPRYRTNASAR